MNNVRAQCIAFFAMGMLACPEPTVGSRDSGILPDSGEVDTDSGVIGFDAGEVTPDAGFDAGFDAGDVRVLGSEDVGRYWAFLDSRFETDAPGEYWFEARESSSASWDAGLTTPRLSLGANESIPRAWVYGLKPGTAYQYRACHLGDGGTPRCTEGARRTLTTRAATSMRWIVRDPTHARRLAYEDGGAFNPFGNNLVNIGGGGRYDLIEDTMYSDAGMQRIASNFLRHKFAVPDAGALNTIRIHLQFAHFIVDGGAPHREAFARMAQVVELAEDRGLYLMLTGLNYFYPGDNPAWVYQQAEAQHWATQALWWRNMATALAHSPSPFLFDLMNEPVVPGNWVMGGEYWYMNINPRTYCSYGADPDAGIHGTCFPQFITSEPGTRTRSAIAAAWVALMRQAIRGDGGVVVDARHLITAGAADTKMTDPFQAASVYASLDVISPHLYPTAADGGQETIDFVAAQSALSGKPIVVGETFSLPGNPSRMVTKTCRAGTAIGWIGQQLGGDDFGGSCTLPGPWFCAFWDLWYTQQRALGDYVLAGQCPPDVP